MSASKSRRALLDQAKRERAELRAWVAGGRGDPRPLTPAIDVLALERPQAPRSDEDGGRRGD